MASGTRWQRFLRFPLIRIVVGIIWMAIPFAVLQIIGSALGLKFGDPASGLIALAIPAAAIGAYLSFVRVVERRRPAELERTGAARELGVGFAIGAVLFSATILAICVGASCAIGAGDGALPVLVALAWAVSAAVFEELA